MQWGLALSGGIAWGIANAGIWEVFEEEHLQPHAIGGSSMGAIVGGLVALGHGATVLRTLAGGLRLTNIARPQKKPFEGGLHAGLLQQELRKHLEPYVGSHRIADCRIPFLCVAAEMREAVAWHRIASKDFAAHAEQCLHWTVLPPETPLLEAFLATSAMPVLFAPVRIGQKQFVDVCNRAAVPTDVLRDTHRLDVVIATDTNPRMSRLKNFLPAGWRAYYEAGERELERSIANADLAIRPALKSSPWRFDKAMEFIEAGKAAAQEKLPKIRELIS